MDKRIQQSLLVGLVAVAGLSACGERMPTVREMCEKDAQLCADLNDDNWCRSERRQLIISRYQTQLNTTPENQYYQLKDLQSYSQCIELASGIEHKKLKEKQSHRIEAYINSIKAIRALADKTADSKAPLLLYWHWANRNDNEALDELLRLEETKAMQTHELQFALATYYAKEDQSKVLSHLYNALRLYKPDNRFNVEIPESLVTYYLGKEDIKQAYVWSMVAIAFGSELMNERQMRTIVNATEDQYDEWQDIAEDIVDELEAGQFKRRPRES